MSPREAELEQMLEAERKKNRLLHRRVQQAEASRPDLRGRGRAKLATDCVRLETQKADLLDKLGRVRAIAAGWGRQTYPPALQMQQALCDIADIAEVGVRYVEQVDPAMAPGNGMTSNTNGRS